MSADSYPDPSPSPVSAAQLRRMLEQALPGDAQLEAFCIDYVPDVHKQFGHGMERTRKLNLLLGMVESAVLREQLRRYELAVAERKRKLPGLRLLPSAGSGRREKPRVGIASAVLGAVMVAGLALGLHFSRNRAAPSPNSTLGADLVAPLQLSSAATTPLPLLTSDPTSALVYAVPSGRRLGRTPWTPEPSATWESVPQSGLQVCLRSAGFVPVLVTLKPGADPSRIHPVYVRLQPETRAAHQRDLRQETCDVPTPIIE